MRIPAASVSRRIAFSGSGECPAACAEACFTSQLSAKSDTTFMALLHHLVRMLRSWWQWQWRSSTTPGWRSRATHLLRVHEPTLLRPSRARTKWAPNLRSLPCLRKRLLSAASRQCVLPPPDIGTPSSPSYARASCDAHRERLIVLTMQPVQLSPRLLVLQAHLRV
ncbi:hypothetical protein OH77DRAFT_763560 [Trametes cingulata]|nr:hypothetical protein OH77DRAFT_763560 [Trametes cingulata]